MIYCPSPVGARLVRKVNRFLCEVELDGKITGAHIPNSGRLAELMTPGRKVIVERAANPLRKTLYTLRSVWFNGRWVCIDSRTPNALAEQLALTKALPLFNGYSSVRRERTVGRHRFDMELSGGGLRPMLVEVKSVTLVEGGVARFPDAPTFRGASHVETLARLSESGEYGCAVLFVAQRSDAKRFKPNTITDPAFTLALKDAVKSGVEIVAVRCRVGRRRLSLMGPIPVRLE